MSRNKTVYDRMRSGRPWRRFQQRFWALHYVAYCHICGGYIDQGLYNPRHPAARTIDHIIPLSMGGAPYDLSNTAPAHNACNASKRDALYGYRHGGPDHPTDGYSSSRDW